MLRITIDTSDYDVKMRGLNRNIPFLAERSVESATNIIEQNFIPNIPVKTGNLASSVRKEIEKLSGRVFTTAGYGKFVDEDVDAHRIFGRPLLRFEIDGTVFFRRFVDHPATKGQNFKGKTIEQSEAPILREIVQIYKELTGSK